MKENRSFRTDETFSQFTERLESAKEERVEMLLDEKLSDERKIKLEDFLKDNPDISEYVTARENASYLVGLDENSAEYFADLEETTKRCYKEGKDFVKETIRRTLNEFPDFYAKMFVDKFNAVAREYKEELRRQAENERKAMRDETRRKIEELEAQIAENERNRVAGE